MSDLSSAATLSLKVDTGSAKQEVADLRSAYALLKRELAEGLQAVGGASQLIQSMKTAQAETEALKNKLADYGSKAGKLWIQYGAEVEQGRVSAKRALEGMDSDDVISLSKKQKNERERIATIAKAHTEALALDRKFNADRAAIINEAHAEALTLKKIQQEREAAAYFDGVAALEKAEKAKLAVINEAHAEALTLRKIGQEREAAAYFDGVAALEKAEKAKLAVINEAHAEALTLKKIQQEREADAYFDGVAALEKAEKAKLAVINEAHAEALTMKKIQQERETAIHLEGVEKRMAADKASASWASKSRLEQLRAALPASRAISAGTDASLVHSTGAVNLANQMGSTPAIEAEMAKLSHTTREATGSQLHWNKAADEAHALARGLSGSLGTLWMTYGSIIPLLAGAALGAGFVQAAKQGAEFAYQLTFVKALGEEASGAIELIGKKAQELSQSSLYGPVELANGLRILSQAGLSASDSMKALPQAAQLATVGEMNMEQAAVTLTGVMNAFGLSVSQMPHIGDVFAKAAALSQTSVQGMTEAMKTASVVGEQYGASMEDTATALTLLAKVNISGTAAGTAFRNMAKELYAPVPQAAAALKKLGLETKDASGNLKPFADIIYDLKGRLEQFDKSGQVQILQRLFGERGAKEAIAMLALTRKEWDALKDSISNSEGFMDGVTKELENTAKGQWKQAINTLQVDLIKAFESAEPIMRDIARLMKDMFSSEEFKSGLMSVVTGMASLVKVLVEYGPLIIEAGKGWLIYAAGSTAAALANAAFSASSVAAVGRAALMGQTLLAVATGAATTATGLTGLSGAMALLGGPIGIVTGLVAAGAVAWLMYRDKTVEAMEDSTAKVRQFASEAKVSLDDIARTIGTTNVAMSKAKLEKVGGDVTAINDRLSAQRDVLSKKFGITNDDQVNKVISEATTTGSDGNVYTKESDRYRAAVAYNIALKERNTLADKYYKLVESAQSIEDHNSNQSAIEESKKTKKKMLDIDSILGKTGSTKVGRDYDYNVEKSAIEDLKAQQQQKVAILESARSNQLISEDKFRTELIAINAQYDDEFEAQYRASFVRLGTIAANDASDKGKQALDHYNQMLASYRKFLNDKELNLVKSTDREKGIIKKAQEDLDAFLLKMRTESEKAVERLQEARMKQSMAPEAIAAYDATRSSNERFDSKIDSQRATVKRMDEDGTDQQSAVYKKEIDVLRQLTAEKQRYGRVAGDVARAEVEYSRSFESGWKTSMQNYANDSGNSAMMAQKAFGLAVNTMDSALTEFLEKGTVDWRKMFHSIVVELIKMEARWMISKVMNPESTGDGMLMAMLKGMTGEKSATPAGATPDTAMGGFQVNLGTTSKSVADLGRAAQEAVAGLSGLQGSSVTTRDQFAVMSAAGERTGTSMDKLNVSGTGASTALDSTSASADSATDFLYKMATSPMAGMAAGAAGGSGASGLWGMAAGMIANYFMPGSGTMVSGIVNAGVGIANKNYVQAAQGFGGALAGYSSQMADTKTLAPVETRTKSAKGNAFDSTSMVRQFAKGSAFGSSIVTNPTLFRYASGGGFSLGEMGEAGPEAVMPLARDNQGRLGVRSATQGNSQSAKATPQEPPQNNIRIINAFDTAVIGDYLGSANGEKVIMNAVKRNQGTIKQMARA